MGRTQDVGERDGRLMKRYYVLLESMKRSKAVKALAQEFDITKEAVYKILVNRRGTLR